MSSLGRAEDPIILYRGCRVNAIWPGATAGGMQSQVADRIEGKLRELPYFDKVTDLRTSRRLPRCRLPSWTTAPAKDVPQLFYQLRKKLGDIRR